MAPHISNRMTLQSLLIMKKNREQDDFQLEEDNEFDRVKKLVKEKERLDEEKYQIEELKDKLKDEQYTHKIKKNKKEKTKKKDEVIQHLKIKFKHINGMWPKTANFENEDQRMESHQTSRVINKKILKPAKRLVVCQKGIDVLQKHHNKYDAFLKNFRSIDKKKDTKGLNTLRTSVCGSSVGSDQGEEKSRYNMRMSIDSRMSKAMMSTTSQAAIRSSLKRQSIQNDGQSVISVRDENDDFFNLPKNATQGINLKSFFKGPQFKNMTMNDGSQSPCNNETPSDARGD